MDPMSLGGETFRNEYNGSNQAEICDFIREPFQTSQATLDGFIAKMADHWLDVPPEMTTKGPSGYLVSRWVKASGGEAVIETQCFGQPSENAWKRRHISDVRSGWVQFPPALS